MSEAQTEPLDTEPPAPEASEPPKKEPRAVRWKKKLERLLSEDTNIYPLF